MANNNNNDSSALTVCQHCSKHFAYIQIFTTISWQVALSSKLRHGVRNLPGMHYKCWGEDVDRVGVREYFKESMSQRKWKECRKRSACQCILHISRGLVRNGSEITHWSWIRVLKTSVQSLSLVWREEAGGQWHNQTYLEMIKFEIWRNWREAGVKGQKSGFLWSWLHDRWWTYEQGSGS